MGTSMVAFSETEYDVDPSPALTPANALPPKGIDLRRKGPGTETRVDPAEVFEFNDPLFSRQWHLVSTYDGKSHHQIVFSIIDKLLGMM